MAQREELILDITAKLDQALRDVTALQEQIEALAKGAETTITATVEGAEAVESLAEQTAELDETEATVGLDAEDNASEAVEEVAEGMDDLDGAEAEIELDADDNASDAVEDVQGAVDDLDGSQATVEVEVEGGEEAQESLGGIVDSLGKMGAGALGGLAAAGIGKVLEASAEATLQIQGLADATGASLEQASGLAEQFDFVGVNAIKLLTMIGRVNDAIAESPELAARLNIDAALPPMELFIEAVDALNSGALSAADTMTLGIELFGRRGATSVNAIKTQIGDLGQAVENIPEFQVVTEDDVDAAIEMKETMDELGDAIAEVAQKAVTVLGPALEGIKIALEELPVDVPGFDFGPVFDAAFNQSALQGFLETFTDQEEVVRALTDAIEANAISRAEWNEITADSVITAEEAADAADREATVAERLGEVWGDAATGIDDAATASEQIVKIADEGAGAIKKLADASTLLGTSTDQINKDLDAQAEALRSQEDAWATIIADMTDANGVVDDSAVVYHQLQTELKLNNQEMADLVNQKVAAKLEADAVAAGELQAALLDLNNVIGSIDADDLGNIAGGLQEALDVGDVAVDFQSIKERLRSAFDDLATFIEDEDIVIDWAKVLDTSQDTGLSAELLGMVGRIRDQFQTGITSAFEIGGAGAAQHFVDSFLPQLAALGMSPAQAYEFLGLPADGSVDVLLKPLVDEQAKADALAIIGSLMGVDPNNPILAFLQLSLQTDTIDPQVAEIVARILAAEALQLPVQLGDFSQADIDAAYAIIAASPAVVPVTTQTDATEVDTTMSEATAPRTADVDVDDKGTVDKFKDDADDATEDRTTHVIVPKSPSLGQMETLINAVARDRTVQFNAKSDNAGAMDNLLDAVAADRNADIFVIIHGGVAAEARLDQIAEDRYADIYVQQHGSVSTGGAAPGPSGLSAEPTARAAPAVTATPGISAVTMAAQAVAVVPARPTAVTVNVNSAVIGSRFEVMRVVAAATRQALRLGA